jgi:hypothetical protein
VKTSSLFIHISKINELKKCGGGLYTNRTGHPKVRRDLDQFTGFWRKLSTLYNDNKAGGFTRLSITNDTTD